jgi:site-specific recombinase XerD
LAGEEVFNMLFKNDLELIESFHMKSGHSTNSVRSYNTVFNNYRNYHGLSLCELLDEAIREQEDNVAENRLRIYDHILDFRNFLIENYTGNTISNSISKIKTFYHYNRVRIPFIPPLNRKAIRKNDAIAFDELLTKEELKSALEIADDELKLWILGWHHQAPPEGMPSP